MTTFTPPKASKRISALNRGDLFGNLVETRDMDFNNRGYIELAGKPYVLLTETVSANFETPLAVAMDDSDVYVVTSESVYSIDPRTADFAGTELTTGTAPGGGFQADGVFYNGELHASDTSGVHSLSSGGSWASDISGLSTSYPHPLCVSEHQNYLAVGNGNSVIVYNTSYVSQATLTIPSEYVVTWIRWRANFLWIGTRNLYGGDAKVYTWNGSGSASQGAYNIPGEWVFSGCVYPGTIVVIASTGQWLRFAGDDFVPLRNDAGEEMAFPCHWAKLPWGSSSSTSNLLGKVASRGMEARGRLIYVNVDSEILGDNGGFPDYLPNFPSGLWVFDPAVGLYHKAGCDHLVRQEQTVSSISSDTITVSGAAVFETGDPIHLINTTNITGADPLMYYAIKVSSTQLKIAISAKDAEDGTAVTISGTGSGASVCFNTYESNGAVKLGRAGGLAVIKSLSWNRFNGNEVVYGADVELPAGGTVGAVMSLGRGRSEGFFVTPKIQAEQVTDKFKKLISKFGTLNISTWEIILKYRTEERFGLPGRLWFDNGVMTWVTTSSLTVNPTNYDVSGIQAGDEIQFLYEGGAGFTRHINTITVDSATQWTLTLDEAVPDVTANDTTRAVVQNWTKYKTISGSADAEAAAKGLKKALLAKDAKWCQIKVLIRGYRDVFEAPQVEEVMLLTGADQKYA